MDSTDRVTEVEIQLTHLQRTYEQLNEVVIEQAKDILSLRKQVSKLKEALEESKAQPSAPPEARDEKPPHY